MRIDVQTSVPSIGAAEPSAMQAAALRRLMTADLTELDGSGEVMGRAIEAHPEDPRGERRPGPWVIAQPADHWTRELEHDRDLSRIRQVMDVEWARVRKVSGQHLLFALEQPGRRHEAFRAGMCSGRADRDTTERNS